MKKIAQGRARRQERQEEAIERQEQSDPVVLNRMKERGATPGEMLAKAEKMLRHLESKRARVGR